MALGTTEVLIIIGGAIVLFGAPSVIKWAKALRQAKHEFNKPPTDEEDVQQ